MEVDTLRWEEAAEERVHATEQVEPAAVNQRLVGVVRHHDQLIGHVFCRSSCTRPMVWANGTLRSSSPCQISTGDFHPSIAAIVDDRYDTSVVSSEFPQSGRPPCPRRPRTCRSCAPAPAT